MCPTPFFSANSKRDDFFLSLGTVYLGSKSSYVSIFRFHLQVTSYSICRSLSVLLHLLWSSLPSGLFLDTELFHSSWRLAHVPLSIQNPFYLFISLSLSTWVSAVSFIWKLVRQGWHGYPCLRKCFFSLTVSPGTSTLHFLKILLVLLSSGWTNGVFSNPIQTNFLMGVAIPKLVPFLSCEPSFLIISWVCSHPSTLSFSFERHYSVCFGLQQSDSIAKSCLCFCLLHTISYCFS